MTDVASPGADIHRAVLEATSDALGLAVLVCDKNDEIVYASRAILQFYPIQPHFLQIGGRLRDFLGAIFDSGVPMGTALEKSRRRVSRDEWISEQLSFHWRERFETAERVGRQRWFSMRRRRLPNGMGILALSDISEQKKREEQMHLDLERIEVTEGILDSLPNPICIKDRGLTYIAVNKAFCAVHGIAPDAILGRTVWDLLEPDLAEKFERSDQLTLETGEAFCTPEQIVQADGEDLWVVTRKYRIGTPGKYLLVTCMNDVTDLVIGYEDAAGISANAAHLKVRDFEVFEPAQNCYDPFRSIDMHHLLEASAMIGADAPVKTRVLLMTRNPAREQSLVPQLRRWGFDACAVRSAQELAEFRDAAARRAIAVDILLIDGFVNELQEAQSIWPATPSLRLSRDWKLPDLKAAISDVLEGGTSGCEPLDEAGVADWDIVLPDATDREHLPEVEVVVAEDNEINQFVFSQILEGLGISYRMAANGEEAVRLWHDHRPNLVLMDISLPVMNGFDAAAAIRAAERGTLRQTPIVAVITQAMDIDRDQCVAAGMNDTIMKPVSPDMIEAIYRKFVTVRTERLAS